MREGAAGEELVGLAFKGMFDISLLFFSGLYPQHSSASCLQTSNDALKVLP